MPPFPISCFVPHFLRLDVSTPHSAIIPIPIIPSRVLSRPGGTLLVALGITSATLVIGFLRHTILASSFSEICSRIFVPLELVLSN
jgi:hypothetical protein